MGQSFQATVVVATYGRWLWQRLAEHRAIPSAEAEGVPVISVHRHDGTLAEARNACLEQVETEWVVHLDADDELEPGYIEALASGSADLRCPSIRQVMQHGQAYGPEPFVPRVYGHKHECVAECLRQGNWMIIGTAARVDMLREVGGWEEWGWSEDWALWARCWMAGGTCEAIPEAVYKAYKRHGSRNRVSRSSSLRWHREIEQAVFGEVTV